MNTLKTKAKYNAQRGISLLEAMIAVTIAIIGMSGYMGITAQTSGFDQNVAKRMTANSLAIAYQDLLMQLTYDGLINNASYVTTEDEPIPEADPSTGILPPLKYLHSATIDEYGKISPNGMYSVSWQVTPLLDGISVTRARVSVRVLYPVSMSSNLQGITLSTIRAFNEY